MIIDIGKYYLYRHIRIDKDEPFYIGIGTKKSFIKSHVCKSSYYRAYEKGGRCLIWNRIVEKKQWNI